VPRHAMTRLSAGPRLLCLGVVVSWSGAVGASGQEPGDAVQNAPPYPTWSVGSAPVLRLGAVMGPDADLNFSDIRFVAELSDGQIVVVDGASSEVRWFSEDGTLNSRAGGPGQGPGELARVESGAVLGGDTLVLFDSRNERLSWFSSDGKLSETRRLALGMSLGASLHDVGDGTSTRRRGGSTSQPRRRSIQLRSRLSICCARAA